MVQDIMVLPNGQKYTERGEYIEECLVEMMERHPNYTLNIVQVVFPGEKKDA